MKRNMLRAGLITCAALVTFMVIACEGSPLLGVVRRPRLLILQGENPIADGGVWYNTGVVAGQSSDPISFTIDNTEGTTDLLFTATTGYVAVTEGLFSVDTQPSASIGAGSSGLFSLVYFPDGAEMVDVAAVTINSNDPDYPSFSFYVVGHPEFGDAGPVGTDVGGGFLVSSFDPGGGFEATREVDDEIHVLVKGTFTAGLNWTSDRDYFLDGYVFIGDGTEDGSNLLTIEGGTTIYGLMGVLPASLVISQYSQINADGNAANPIVFTSTKWPGAPPAWPGTRSHGDWGGIVINGLAPVNREGDQIMAGPYGGDAQDDNSGFLTYVRIEFCGGDIPSMNLATHGLALHGVGYGTTIDHVQVHCSANRGVGVEGGNVDLRHIVVTGNYLNGLSWGGGWQGSAQYVIAQKYPGLGTWSEIGGSSNSDDNNAEPRSNPTIANLTVVGNGVSSGFFFAAGTDAKIVNAIVENVNIGSDEITAGIGDARDITYWGVNVDGANMAEATDWGPIDDGCADGPSNLVGADAQLIGDGDQYSFDMVPSAAPDFASPQATGLDSNGDGYIGAISPGEPNPWTDGWITTAAY